MLAAEAYIRATSEEGTELPAELEAGLEAPVNAEGAPTDILVEPLNPVAQAVELTALKEKNAVVALPEMS